MDLIKAEINARKLIELAVTRHNQHQLLQAYCAENAENAENLTKNFSLTTPFICETKIMWIRNRFWIDLCSDLSLAKTRPLRWYMVITQCRIFKLQLLNFSDQITDDSSTSSTKSNNNRHRVIQIKLIHWLSKS